MTCLVRDVLDKQLLDVNGTKMGKVDGIVLALREGRPPRVAALETGPATLARRLSPRLAALVQRLEHRMGLGGGGALRIAVDRILRVGIDVQVAVIAEETCAFDWEDWLREHVVERIPGSGEEE